ncbi:MAG: AsnC family transcriptional regulator, partial [Nanoarchaeota archaeon]|nr:AsnC family transcriptional regulator [Nanoarchaeota archaeon]
MSSNEPVAPLKLDVKDRKILYQLDVNARQSASEIGRKVGLDKQVVAYRIHRLLEEGAISQFYAVYDTSKLGFTTYKILIRLQNTTTAKEQEIIQFITTHPRVQFSMSCDGNFDLVFNVLAKSAIELNEILADFENKYGAYIAEKQLIIMLLSSFFTRDYLLGKKISERRKPVYFGSKPEEIRLDETDYSVLGLLGEDARMPLIEIAKRSKASADTVALRIRKLEKSGIIHAYLLLPQFSALGQLSYKLLFSLHHLSKERESALYEFCRQH